MAPVEKNGWKLFAHPAFLTPLRELRTEVEQLRRRDPRKFMTHPKAKLLRRIVDLILVEIPNNPNAPAYQLGNTMGSGNRHWRRAKFFERFRLFFRFHSKAKIIIYAWVNDENSLRQRGGRFDVYSVFCKRLLAGDPPGDWDSLVKEAMEFEE